MQINKTQLTLNHTKSASFVEASGKVTRKLPARKQCDSAAKGNAIATTNFPAIQALMRRIIVVHALFCDKNGKFDYIHITTRVRGVSYTWTTMCIIEIPKLPARSPAKGFCSGTL